MAFPRTPFAVLLQLAWVLIASAAEPAIGPSLDQARINAFPIFNSIHSAIRQWGSSLNHNGLAMIPAKVPKGNLLYHGTHSSEKTVGFEWLAFEPEHSEAFSVSWRAHQQRDISVSGQAVLSDVNDSEKLPEPLLSGQQPSIRGYLRTYQARRDLNLLYVDGMSAGKGCLGTMDTQDLILRMINGTSPCDHYMVDVVKHDMARISEFCEIFTPLGYDGILRMEAGFEIVYCDFDDGGLRLLSQLRRPFWDKMKEWYDFARLAFHIVRAASQHYDGMAEAGRLQVDFSRMVSAYFYPVNITYPDANADEQLPARRLPRLLSTTRSERQAIQRRVQEVAVPGSGPGINWQAIVDAVVSRYADRLTTLVRLSPGRLESDAEQFSAEIFVATNTHVDFPSTPDDVSILAMDADDEAAARARCQNHYLRQIELDKASFTPEDHLIYAAITQVTGRICGTLFQARSRIHGAYHSETHDPEKRRSALSRAAEISQESVRKLMGELQWTRWEKCGDCGINELCFVPMFPIGSLEDHQKPRCLNESRIGVGLNLTRNYWQFDVIDAFSSMTMPF